MGERISSPYDIEDDLVEDHVIEEGGSTCHVVRNESHNAFLNEVSSSQGYAMGDSNSRGHVNHDPLEYRSQIGSSYHVSPPIFQNEVAMPQGNTMGDSISQEHVSNKSSQIGFPIQEGDSSYHVTPHIFQNEVTTPQGHAIGDSISKRHMVSSNGEDEDEVSSLGMGSLLELMMEGTKKSIEDVHILNNETPHEQEYLELVHNLEDPDMPTIIQPPTMEHMEDTSPMSNEKTMRFASISKMMDKQGGENIGKKKSQGKGSKRKVFKAVHNETTSIPIEPNTDMLVSRSSRAIKRPTRYIEKDDDKENQVNVQKKSKETSKKDKSLHKCKTKALVDKDIGELEAIAVEAMGIHDVDDMYSHLWQRIKEVKSSNISLLKECSSKSDPANLLHCYATWVLKTSG